MSSAITNILDVYEEGPNTFWYLEKYFTNTDSLGFIEPNTPNPILSKATDKTFIATVDEDNTYEINRFGFRGEVYEDAEILASGCSLTFGIGIPELGRWTNFLSKKMNKGIMNLGSPGASVESICLNIIKYCMNNKMPKEIFCLMPDFFRRMVVLDENFYQSKKDTQNSGNHKGLMLTFCNPEVDVYEDDLVMKIKNKKYIEDATSPHQLIINSVNAIYMLEAFCLTNNIKLYWTTWDLPTSKLMEKLSNLEGFILKRYTPFFTKDNERGVNNFVQDNCSWHHRSEFKDSLQWAKGSDYSIINGKKTGIGAHPGIHCHEHIANFFYDFSEEEKG